MEAWLASSPSVQVCPGDTLTFVCNITRMTSHIWTISHIMEYPQLLSTIVPLPSITGLEFNAYTIPDGLVSTVKFNVTMSHTVTCYSTSHLFDTQETNVTLLGKNV